MYLNGKNVLYVKTTQIVMNYLDKDLTNIIRLRRCLQKDMNTVQFVYSRCFPEIYSLIDRCGIDMEGELLLSLKAWKDKKKFLPEKQQNNELPAEVIKDKKSKQEDEIASKKLEKKT